MNQNQVRNFVIISHVNHGKSTLADRFLELTGAVSEKKMRHQFLDMMDLERERGITIKMQPVRMVYKIPNNKSQITNKFQIPNSNDQNSVEYILNLIDTPGHVDFSYEVSRSLAAVEGAVLLVDASKGIQAQTLANLDLAQKQGLVIIPVVNKIDLAQAQIEETVEELAQLLNVDRGEVIKISAKKGTNVKKVLEAVIEKVPSPQSPKIKPDTKFRALEHGTLCRVSAPFRALIFDSKYNPYKGIIAYVRVVDGEIKIGQKIRLLITRAKGEAKEIGYFTPEFSPQKNLSAGEIGYIATGIKGLDKLRIGDTVAIANFHKSITNFTNKHSSKFVPKLVQIRDTQPLAGYKEAKPMVFASLYPESPDNFNALKNGLSKLKLNDSSLFYEPETKEALGRGFRCGFLGTLHTEIVSERLKREFDLDLIISTPSVVYKIKDDKNREKFIYSASDWPESSIIKESQEPWASLEVVTPNQYMGPLSEILKNLRGDYIDTKYLGTERIILEYQVPLREVIVNLYDKIKSATQGFASMNYKFLEYRPMELNKLEVLIAGEKEEAFSKIVPKNQADKEARALAKKIKDSLPAQQFSVPIQVIVGGKIIARETKKAQRKDVIAPLYGGDYSRKRKLLEKQKKGKKKLASKGRVRIPPKVFLDVFRG